MLTFFLHIGWETAGRERILRSPSMKLFTVCNTNEFTTVTQRLWKLENCLSERIERPGSHVNTSYWWLSEPLRPPHPAKEATSIRHTGSIKRWKMVTGATAQQNIAQSFTLFLQLAFLGSCVLHTCDAHTPDHPSDVEDSSWTGVTVGTLTGQQLCWDVLCILTPFCQN